MKWFPKKKALLKWEPLSRLLTFIWTHLLIRIWNISGNGLSGGNKGPDFSGPLVYFIPDNPYFSCDDPIIDSDNLLQIIQNKMKSYWNYNTFSPIGNKAQYKMHEKEQYQLGYRLPNITKGDIVINVHLKRKM